MLCTSQRCWPWSIYSLILTWWAIYWLTNKPLNLSGNEAGVLQHSAPSLAFYHRKNYLCCVKLLRTSQTASYDWSEPGSTHRWPPCEPFPRGVNCTAILLVPTWVKYHHAYSHRDHMYPTAILANLYHSLTNYTHDWTSTHTPYCVLGLGNLPRCSLTYKYSHHHVKDTYRYHCHCSHLRHHCVDREKIVCQMWCQITATVPHCLHTIKKLTRNHKEGTLGPESDCCAQHHFCATIIDLPILMDPVSFLLLFNITVWLYWTVK